MKFKVIILFFVIDIIPKSLFANVKVNAIFSNHMVVQRDTEIPVWGWADPNEKVEVSGSWGKIASTLTGADGNWRVDLQTPKAGGPYIITICGMNKIVLDDVLSGDVWLCAGQSNMDFALEKFLNDSREPQYQPLVEYIRNEVANVNDDWIRHIEVPQTTSLFEKKTNFEGNWIKAEPNQIKKITAIGYFFAKELRKHLNVPIGLVECSWGGTRIQPWLPEDAYMADKDMKAYFESENHKIKVVIENVNAENYKDTAYVTKLSAWKENGMKTPKPYPKVYPTEDKQLPATLYNGMLSAIIPYAIKGCLWYQGESNSHFLEDDYEKYFTTLIKRWRAAWGQGDFPFYWMQLSGYQVPDERSDLGWATVNDKLRRTLKLPNTGMAVLYDIGEAKDVHPHNKMDAGKRLALWALKKDYHKKVSAVSGPLYESNTIKGNKVQLQFTEVGSGLMVANKHLLNPAVSVDEPLKWFEIVGEDGVWKPAQAKIISKNKIEVWNATISKPKYVRYAWSSYPEGANLYNKEVLPAAVFSTENNK